MAKWQPKDAAPKDGTNFLSWDGEQFAVVVWCGCKRDFFLAEGKCVPHSEGPTDWEFTHWALLPRPPK